VALLHREPELSVKGLEELGTLANQATAPTSSLFDIDHFEVFRETAEKLYLEQKLAENDWNVKRTAERLAMQRSNLYKKIDRHTLRKPEG